MSGFEAIIPAIIKVVGSLFSELGDGGSSSKQSMGSGPNSMDGILGKSQDGPMSTPGMTSGAFGGGLLGGEGGATGGGAQMAAEGGGEEDDDTTRKLAQGAMMSDNFAKYGGGPGQFEMKPIEPFYGRGKDMSTYANLDSLMQQMGSQRRPVQWQPPRRREYRRGMLG
jgi:hypothetical protein